MGNIFFLDNYFSILGNAVSNRKLSDSNKMSRELFAFNVNVVACAICVLVPIALWGVFMSGNIENVLGLEEGTGIAEIAKAVPFMFYAWVSLVFVLLYNFKIIPLFGNMKKAELRAEQTGQVFPDSTPTEQTEDEEKPETNIINFLLPMIALIGTTVVTGELTYGLVVGVVLCLVMYIAQGILKPAAAFDSIVGGFCDMMICTAIVISAFVLQQANDALGLAPFVIEAVQPFMSPNMLPVVTFCVLLSLGFVTGSFWGMAAVCFPIVLPLALAIDANLSLTIGAVISGAAAASTVCFYCDSVTLTCSITKIKNIEYARTALPLAVPMIIVAIILYLIVGFAL
jgi:Na+/H+ antiporter NhaC